MNLQLTSKTKVIGLKSTDDSFPLPAWCLVQPGGRGGQWGVCGGVYVMEG